MYTNVCTRVKKKRKDANKPSPSCQGVRREHGAVARVVRGPPRLRRPAQHGGGGVRARGARRAGALRRGLGLEALLGHRKADLSLQPHHGNIHGLFRAEHRKKKRGRGGPSLLALRLPIQLSCAHHTCTAFLWPFLIHDVLGQYFSVFPLCAHNHIRRILSLRIAVFGFSFGY